MFDFFADPALTTRITGSLMLTVNGAADRRQCVIYFGATDPTVSAIPVGAESIFITASSADLLLSVPALPGIVPGQAIDIGISLAGGIPNALALMIEAVGVDVADISIGAGSLEVIANG